jgi:heat-inducible transcriptional repressor
MTFPATDESEPIDERKSIILKTVIDAYISSPTPVASRVVEQKSGLDVSAATIRNEMHVLEEAGYLAHTHTSSGRIPTDKGYRHFVDTYISRNRRHSSNPDVINFTEFDVVSDHLKGLLDQTVHTLSSMTSHTAILVKDEVCRARVADVHCSIVGEEKIVVAFIMDDSSIERVVVDSSQLGGEITSEELHDYSRDLSAAIVGKTLSDAHNATLHSHSSQQFVDVVYQSIGDIPGVSQPDARVHLSGVSHIASHQPVETESVFAPEEITTRLLSLLEQHMVLVDLIRESVDDSISARIGSENVVDEMSQHTMVLAPFSTAHGESGAVGIIGPTRMDYKKVFTHLDAASHQLKDVLDQA